MIDFMLYLQDTKEEVALKCVKKTDTDVEALEERIQKELQAWRTVCQHPNVVDLYAYFDTSIYYCFAMEMVPFGNLKDFVKNRGE